MKEAAGNGCLGDRKVPVTFGLKVTGTHRNLFYSYGKAAILTNDPSLHVLNA